MTEINIPDGDGDDYTNIVTALESSTFEFSIKIMDGQRIGENRWALPKARRSRLEDLLRSEFERTGPPVEAGPYLVHHTEMEIRPDSALLAGDEIAGLKDARDGGGWLSDDVIPCHRARIRDSRRAVGRRHGFEAGGGQRETLCTIENANNVASNKAAGGGTPTT